MKLENSAHLQEEEVVWAVIDENELAGKDRLHLRECRVCRSKVELFRRELHEFGRKAGQAVPSMRWQVILPADRPARASHYGGWLPLFGAAAMACLLVFFYAMGLQTLSLPAVTTLQGQENLLEDESLLEEISEMVDNPFADELYEFTGESETGLEEFWEFVVPDAEEDFQAELIIRGGEMQC